MIEITLSLRYPCSLSFISCLNFSLTELTAEQQQQQQHEKQQFRHSSLLALSLISLLNQWIEFVLLIKNAAYQLAPAFLSG